MKKLAKNALKTIFPLLLGVCILVWVYWDFDFSKVKDILLHGMNWWWMIASLFFGVFSQVVRGWRWLLTLEPLHVYPKKANSVNAVFISYAANLILPRVGEISRCGVLTKYDGISFAKSFGTVVTERLIDSLCVLMITGIAVIAQITIFNRFFKATGTDIGSITETFTSMHFYIILICTVAVLILLFYLIRTLSFFEKVKGVVLNIWEGIISLRRVKNIPLFLLYTFLIWFCYFMQFFLTLYCFSFTSALGPWAGLVLFVAGTLAVIVPTPNGAGPWHFAIISMLTLYGVEASNAGAFALIVHGVQTFLIILLGVFALITLPIINKKVLYENNSGS